MRNTKMRNTDSNVKHFINGMHDFIFKISMSLFASLEYTVTALRTNSELLNHFVEGTMIYI